MSISKKRIRLLAVLSACMALIFVLLLAVGNYFFDYALVRKGDVTDGANREVESVAVSSITESYFKNYESQVEATNYWLKTVDRQDIFVTSKDNLRLHGVKFLANTSSHTYAIIVHGYSSSCQNVFDLAQHYQTRGYNVVTPDLRACGESEGTYIGMGWLDKDDILIWSSLILDKDPEAKIVLHGVSMGAATVMMLSGEALPKNVVAIIEDCGYTRVGEVFSSELKLRFNLPPFPIINFASLVAKLRAGYSFEEASSLEQIKKASTPILFIHGSLDDFIPVEMCQRLYDAANCKKEKLIIDGARHNQSRFLQPDEYYQAVFNFIGNNT